MRIGDTPYIETRESKRRREIDLKEAAEILSADGATVALIKTNNGYFLEVTTREEEGSRTRYFYAVDLDTYTVEEEPTNNGELV